MVGGFECSVSRVGVRPFSLAAMHIVFAGWPASRRAAVLLWSASARSRDINAGAHGRLTTTSNFTNTDPADEPGLRPNVNGNGGPPGRYGGPRALADGDTRRRIAPVTE